ncbi:MAG TPA: iron-sulfur cluster assembly scaffold protein [Candidatus Woesearchaeota archaeon]|nr:iron-sulfur cluster assembly scaffold protein [Candidatus Woesearchaeota archaeon]
MNEGIKYSKKIMDLFLHPKNVGELKDADGVGKVGSAVCGDIMVIYIKVAEQAGKKIIMDTKFRTFGCAAAIASSSMLTEMVKGKTLEEAEKLTWKDIEKALDGLPLVKTHCAVLAIDALKAAIKDYKQKLKGEKE